MPTELTNVRFEGNNGHDADVTRCLLMTIADMRGGRVMCSVIGAASSDDAFR